MRKTLRSHRFDIALDPQGLAKSAMLAWLSGAPQRIGFAKPRGREGSDWLHNRLCQPRHSHLVDCQLELLNHLDIEPQPAEFRLPRDTEAEQRVETFLQAVSLSAGDFAVINPGAGWDSKLWPAERFGRIAEMLGRRLGVRSVAVWAGARERAWAQEIVDLSGGAAEMAPPTSLPELTSLVRRGGFFVGSDTGPLHIAAAAGVPCVGLYGVTRPEDCGPYGSQHITVQEYYQTGSAKQRRRADNLAMRAIETETVFQACERLWQNVSRAQAA